MSLVGAKVDYWTPAGHQRTAYLDNVTHDQLVAHGTEKHTDVAVILVRDSLGEPWTEAA